MRLLGVSFVTKEGDISGNISGGVAMVRAFCQTQPVDLVVFPEMFTCGYCALDLTPWAEDKHSETFNILDRLAEEIDAIVGWGFAEWAAPGKVRNSFALIEPGKAPTVVRKTHLHISQPGTRENEPEFLLPGDTLGIVDTRIGRLGIMICYDGCFVEVPRSLMLKGAQLLLWPARSGGYLAGTGFPRIRAIDNVAPVVLIEGAQVGGDFALPSHSQIFDHQGNLLAESREHDSLILADIDLQAAADFRATALGAWAQYRVRRPELYGPITKPGGIYGE